LAIQEIRFLEKIGFLNSFISMIGTSYFLQASTGTTIPYLPHHWTDCSVSCQP